MNGKKAKALRRDPMVTVLLERGYPGKRARRIVKRMVTRGDQGQRPVLAVQRKRTPHEHELRDGTGQAVTLVGRDPLRRIGIGGREIRRTWLGGISAQRGF